MISIFDKIEDSRTEFKEVVNEELEREVVGFLTSNGGDLYIGIDNNGKIVGINSDIDKLQLEIKDRIKCNIHPTPLGLFDIDVEQYENKKILHITIAVREAIVNALVHNKWQLENPPKFEIFNDHISITSTGGLPNNITEEEFLNGYSFPRNPELMRVFKDLDLVEQLGTGIIRILKVYDKSVYEFSDNFIRVNFKFSDAKNLSNGNNNLQIKLNQTSQSILDLIKDNKYIAQNQMMKKLKLSRTSITNNIDILKQNDIIKRIGSNKTGYWEINK